MFSYIIGTLEEASENAIVIENQGIGYYIKVPLRVLEELPGNGQQVKIYTSFQVREDSFTLYGFVHRDEADLFEQLISVSGVGPKAALAILSVMSADDVRFAVIGEDVKAFSRAPGIGKKTAQRLIMELKDKISLDETSYGTELPADSALSSSGMPAARSEAFEALVALGYSSSEAAKALSSLEIAEDADTGEILKAALKQMAFL